MQITNPAYHEYGGVGTLSHDGDECWYVVLDNEGLRIGVGLDDITALQANKQFKVGDRVQITVVGVLDEDEGGWHILLGSRRINLEPDEITLAPSEAENEGDRWDGLS